MLRPDPGTDSLSHRVVASGLWLAALAGTGRLIGLLRLVLLAHVLGPREFGLVGAALVTIGMLEALSDLGIFLALVQRKETPRELLDTAWTLGLIRGGLIATAALLAAPWIGIAFGSREAMYVVAAMAIVPFLASLANVGIVEFRRQLKFGRYYLIQVGAIVADLLVAVPLALWSRSAWAIVGGWLVLSATRVILSYALHPYRPTVRLDRNHLSGLLAYGRWVNHSAVLQWAIGDGVSAIVGRLFGVDGLGIYQMAWRVTGQPVSEAATVISAATVSAYANLQASLARTGRAFLRVLRMTILGVMPVALCLALYADEIVESLLGRGWQQSAVLVRTLALFAMLSVITVVTAPVFQGIGRPKDQALVSFAEALTLVVALPLAISRLGLLGAAVATLARGVVGACLSLWLVERRLAIGWRPLASSLFWPATACLPLILLHLGPFAASKTSAALLAALGTSILSYCAGVFALHRLKLHPLDPYLIVAPLQRLATADPDAAAASKDFSTDVAERP